MSLWFLKSGSQHSAQHLYSIVSLDPRQIVPTVPVVSFTDRQENRAGQVCMWSNPATLLSLSGLYKHQHLQSAEVGIIHRVWLVLQVEHGLWRHHIRRLVGPVWTPWATVVSARSSFAEGSCPRKSLDDV